MATKKKQRNSFIVLDTLCGPPLIDGDYSSCPPKANMIEKVNALYEKGHRIILQSNIKFRSNNDKRTIKSILSDWLYQNDVYYHEIVIGVEKNDCTNDKVFSS